MFRTTTSTRSPLAATAATGRAETPWTVPPGTTLYLQAILDEGGPQAAWSNLLTVIVQ